MDADGQAVFLGGGVDRRHRGPELMGEDVDEGALELQRARLLREAKYVGDPLQLDLKVGAEWFQVIGVLPDFEVTSTRVLPRRWPRRWGCRPRPCGAG